MIMLEKVVYWLILAFPVVLLTVKPLAMIVFALLSMIGIYISIRERINPFKIESIKLFSYLTIGYFVVMAFSVLMSNEPMNSWIHLSRISHFLVSPFVALAIYRINISIDEIAKSFKIGIIFAGLIALIGFIIGDGVGRFSGMYNANTFGDLAVMMLFFSISNIGKENKQAYIFSLTAVAFGVSAVVLSASRGSIITLVLLLVLYTVIMLKFYDNNHKKIWGIVVFLSIVLGINMLLFGHNTMNRLSTIKADVGQWEGERRTTSVGQRMEMYSAGWKAFLDSPIIGYGYHNCGTAAARYASQNSTVQEKFVGRWHLHDECITSAVNAGLLGLVSLLALYFIPLFLFVKKLNSNPYSRMGVILISGYILLGVTHTLFGYEYETAFFVVMLAWILNRVKPGENTGA
jgi:O-antigen ligase